MNPTLTSNVPPLREALYALSLAKHVPDAELLDDMVRQYPQYADELTDFAIEIAVDALRDEAACETAEAALDPRHVSPAVARAISRFHNRLHTIRQAVAPSTERAKASEPVINPFAALTRDEFRAFAGRIGANTVFVAKLRDRQIEPATLPDRFQRLVANELCAPLDVVIAHFAASSGAVHMRQFYKADAKPSQGQRQSFEEAVRSSGLTEEQQQRLLSL